MALLACISLAWPSPLRWWRALFSPLLVLVGASIASASPVAPRPEYQVKAAFLFNFVQFVEWPPIAFTADADPLVIGVFGSDPFGAALDEAMRGESIQGRSLQVKRFVRIEDASGCHLIFVDQSERTRLEALLGALQGKAVLTVADFDPFVTRGGIIQFTSAKGRIRFRINLDAARRNGMKVSSQLLRHAEVIATKEVR